VIIGRAARQKFGSTYCEGVGFARMRMNPLSPGVGMALVIGGLRLPVTE
jgi:hypothetical protein